jgi:hypothetical protein
LNLIVLTLKESKGTLCSEDGLEINTPVVCFRYDTVMLPLVTGPPVNSTVAKLLSTVI